MAKIGVALEIEPGISGGEENGVDNEDANPENLLLKLEEVSSAYEALSNVS